MNFWIVPCQGCDAHDVGLQKNGTKEIHERMSWKWVIGSKDKLFTWTWDMHLHVFYIFFFLEGTVREDSGHEGGIEGGMKNMKESGIEKVGSLEPILLQRMITRPIPTTHVNTRQRLVQHLL